MNEIEFPHGNRFLLRFSINASEWIPHPYNPPLWALVSFKNFSSYINKNEKSFELSRTWAKENNEAAKKVITKKLNSVKVKFGVGYRFEKKDFVDVALSITPKEEYLLKSTVVWKNESKLSDLVMSHFPDLIREYSPTWLGGQRLDIFIPSQKVAIEYQGIQHYEPVNFFGGEATFLKNKERDKRKKTLCTKNGVTLIEWSYKTEVNFRNLEAEFKKHKIQLQ